MYLYLQKKFNWIHYQTLAFCVFLLSATKLQTSQSRGIPVDKLVFVAKHFGISVDDIIFSNEKNNVPNEISMEDTAVLEQLKLINELDTEEKNILVKLIATFVSKKRFKDYLQKNITAL